MSIEIGTEGEYSSGARCGLPSHIDGVPVPRTWRALSLPRRGFAQALPMIELREDGDAGKAAAHWPEPFDGHEL